jgi:hypothetical protein
MALDGRFNNQAEHFLKPATTGCFQMAKSKLASNITPAFASISDFAIISGISRSSIYSLLGEKKLKAVKFGAKVLVDVEYGLSMIRNLLEPNIAVYDYSNRS